MQHEMGYYRECYTFKRRPIELVFYEGFTEPNQAIYFEKKIKGWSRLKKEALISGDFDKLPILAECKNETKQKNNTKGFDSAQHDK